MAPSADLWFNIARCHEELGAPQRAVEYLRNYLRDQVDAPDRLAVEGRIGRLLADARARETLAARPDMGSVRIGTDIPGASVSVDGRHVGRSPLPEPLTLPPGEHRLDVSLEGYIPFRAKLTVYPRSLTRAHVDLSPLTIYDTIESGRPWTWAIGSIAVAAAAVGLGFTFAAMAEGPDDPDPSTNARVAAYSLAGAGVAGLMALGTYFVESGHRTRKRPVVLEQASR